MSATETRSTHEIAQKGRAVFRRIVEPQLTPEDHGKYVAVAVDHDDFAMALTEIEAVMQILKRHPGTMIHMERAGYPAATKFRRFR
jgi:hypothetical protein